jgi:hypothetical protein
MIVFLLNIYYIYTQFLSILLACSSPDRSTLMTIPGYPLCRGFFYIVIHTQMQPTILVILV